MLNLNLFFQIIQKEGNGLLNTSELFEVASYCTVMYIINRDGATFMDVVLLFQEKCIQSLNLLLCLHCCIQNYSSNNPVFQLAQQFRSGFTSEITRSLGGVGFFFYRQAILAPFHLLFSISSCLVVERALKLGKHLPPA